MEISEIEKASMIKECSEKIESLEHELKDVCFEDSRLKQAYDLLMDEACEELC